MKIHFFPLGVIRSHFGVFRSHLGDSMGLPDDGDRRLWQWRERCDPRRLERK